MTFLATAALHADDLPGHAEVMAWLAARGLRPGEEIPSHAEGGPFIFRDAEANSMTFTYPPRGKVSELAVQKLGHDLRDAGFVHLRRLLLYSGNSHRILYDVYDLNLERSYRVTNRSIDDLRRRSYLRGEMDEKVLTELGGRILDLGCGERARTVLALRRAGLDAYGVDPGADVDLRGDHVRAEPGANTSFADESMRRIFSSYSIFFYAENNPAELRTTLAECDRLLEPGGKLVFAGVPQVDVFEKLVTERPRLVWENSYLNEEIFGPTVTIRKD